MAVERADRRVLVWDGFRFFREGEGSPSPFQVCEWDRASCLKQEGRAFRLHTFFLTLYIFILVAQALAKRQKLEKSRSPHEPGKLLARSRARMLQAKAYPSLKIRKSSRTIALVPSRKRARQVLRVLRYRRITEVFFMEHFSPKTQTIYRL